MPVAGRDILYGMTTGEIDGYQYAVIESTGLIAVRRPDGSIRMLPGAADVAAAVRAFIEKDRDSPENNGEGGKSQSI